MAASTFRRSSSVLRTLFDPSSFRNGFVLGAFMVFLASVLHSSMVEMKGSSRTTASHIMYLQDSGELNLAQQPVSQPSSTISVPGMFSQHANSTTGMETALPDEETPDEDADWELDDFEVEWGSLENYALLTKIGEGEYGEVYKSIDLRNNLTCVVKLLKPVSIREVKREIRVLQHLNDGPNVIKLVDVAMNEAKNLSGLVMEYVNNTYYRQLYSSFTDTEVRFYMFQLLRALDFAHSKGVMHRDIKPHNLMIEHESQKLRLIDWGLSDFFDDQYAYSTSVASRFWRAPELLVEYEWYNLSSDMWAFGCMFAAMIFGLEPFFYGRYNNANQLIKIAEVLGTADLFDWLDKYEIELPTTFNNVSSWYERRNWTEFVNWRNRRLADDDALDLLSQILVYDHNERLSAFQALSHPYFDSIRTEATNHVNITTTWTR